MEVEGDEEEGDVEADAEGESDAQPAPAGSPRTPVARRSTLLIRPSPPPLLFVAGFDNVFGDDDCVFACPPAAAVDWPAPPTDDGELLGVATPRLPSPPATVVALVAVVGDARAESTLPSPAWCSGALRPADDPKNR